MSTTKLQQDLVTLLPRARRYSRALIGDPILADKLLLNSVFNLLDSAPSVSFLTPTNMLLPWLYIEFHKQVDTTAEIANTQKRVLNDTVECTMHERFDTIFISLPELHKRVYLLSALEQFKFSVTARILAISAEQVTSYFQQAHKKVNLQLVK